MYVQIPGETRGGRGIPLSLELQVCIAPLGAGNESPLEEEQALLTTESSLLQPSSVIYF